MGYPTPIEWTDATWNPIGGCSIKSPGCAPCYAQQLAGTRLARHPLYAGTTTTVKGKPVFNGKLTAAPIDDDVWRWPLRWRGAGEPKLGPGMPSLIFVGDMSDLFHENRPRADIDRAVGTGACSAHILQLLTKRPDVMADYFDKLPQRVHDWDCDSLLDSSRLPLDNFWLGMSAERQKEFDERWPHLRRLAHMGYTVFVSYEPAIGPLKLPEDFLVLGSLAQVIAGGVSGREADTPAHPDWFRALRDQCAAAGVPFFFKQWGEHYPCEFDHIGAEGEVWRTSHDGVLRWRFDEIGKTDPDRVWFSRVGKKKAGRLLDGVEHNGLPRWAA